MLPDPHSLAMLAFHAPAGYAKMPPWPVIQRAMAWACARQVGLDQLIRASGAYPAEFAREPQVSHWFRDRYMTPASEWEAIDASGRIDFANGGSIVFEPGSLSPPPDPEPAAGGNFVKP